MKSKRQQELEKREATARRKVLAVSVATNAAICEMGGDRRLLSHLDCDATTLGNYDCDVGLEGLGQAI
jgi:hypothetical protein